MSDINENDFQYRLLYEQKTDIEEGKFVFSKTYACSYAYPGAISRTTCRARTTLVYDLNFDGSLIVNGGTVEKWSDKGWQTIEEFFDTTLNFRSIDKGMTYLLNMFKSFTLGMACFDNITPRDFDPPKPPSDKPPKKPDFLRVLSFKNKDKDDSLYDKYTKDKTEEKDKKDENSDDDDSPDFDWI